MQKQKKTLEQLMTRQREINDSLASIEDVLLKRELNDEEKGNQTQLLHEYETNKREIALAIQEKQAAAVAIAPKKDVNTARASVMVHSRAASAALTATCRASPWWI